MKKLISLLFILFVFGFHINPSIADSNVDFDSLMKDWYQYSSLASESLKEAEKSLKEGDVLSGCITQRKASEYGIRATNSLIRALELDGSTEMLDDLNSGLQKWKELGDFC